MKGILRWKRPTSDCSSAQHTPAPDTMLTGNLKLEWGLPSRLEGQDIREWVLASGALTLKDGVVHIGRCEHEVAKLYGSFGTRVLEGVISAVESPLGSHSMLSKSKYFWFCTNLYECIEDTEFEITISPNLLKCSYATMDTEFLSTLKLTLSWICLLKRNLIRHHIALSKGYWFGETFHLDVMEVVDWSGRSWTKTLGHAIVVCLDHIVPQAPLLSAAFLIAYQLAGVHAPIHVDEGLIYHGGMTALVPIELRKDGSILWHFESRLNDLLKVSEIKCIKRHWYQRRSWFQTEDPELLQSAPALIR